MRKARMLFMAPVLGILVLVSGAAPSFASSHREAPLTAADPQIDSTDLYAFVSPDAPDTVTLISNWIRSRTRPAARTSIPGRPAFATT